ncbi:hypothetical protein ACJ73_03106 [Blastomyces percursus]|uniref:Uncharacterized protein n=1 Tax=Blastomyces percursus TaxID=1658174 RepID=A0A1J9QBS1_9EURO|nr:hypothetical protein ACJ73_03106 [Blastomyces percursus]
MASIREQLRQLEDVNEGMFDENASLHSPIVPVSNQQYPKLRRIVDMLSKVGQDPTPPTPGTPTPSNNDNNKLKPVTDVPTEAVEATS